MLVCIADTLAIAELVIVYSLLCVVKRIYLILCVSVRFLLVQNN